MTHGVLVVPGTVQSVHGLGLCCGADGVVQFAAQMLDYDEVELVLYCEVGAELGVESLFCLAGPGHDNDYPDGVHPAGEDCLPGPVHDDDHPADFLPAGEDCLPGTEPSWQEYHCCHSGTEWLLISETLWTDQTEAPGGEREGGEGVGVRHGL